MHLLLIIFICISVIYILMILPMLGRKKQMEKYLGCEFAHRGYHAKEHGIPENSMLAFKEALKRGLGIELDVHLTKDKQVVVFHDDTLKRMCKDPRRITQLTYSELKQFYLLHTSEKIPLLSEVLNFIDGRVPLLIELKTLSQDTTICARVYELLEHYSGNYLIQSFNSLAIRWFRVHAPQVLRGQLSSNLNSPKEKEPLIFRFMVRFLLTNCLCRPDFISYKLDDAKKNLSLYLNQHLFKTPVGVWTLRNETAFQEGKSKYFFVIFENFIQFY